MPADSPVTATPSQVNSAIVNAATTNRISGVNGSPNRLLYSFFDSTEPPPPPPEQLTPTAVKAAVTSALV